MCADMSKENINNSLTGVASYIKKKKKERKKKKNVLCKNGELSLLEIKICQSRQDFKPYS